MIQEFLGAALDFSYLLWLWLPGVVFALLLGFRHFLDLVSIGVIVSAAVSSLVYLATYSLGLSTISIPVTRGVLLVLFLIGIFVLRKQLWSLVSASFVVAVVIAVSVILRNILRLDGWMGDTDHLITLWVAELMQGGDEGPIFEFSAAQKKGLIFPLLLGMGRSGLFLGAIPVVIFILVILTTVRIIQTVTEQRLSKPLIAGLAIVLFLWVSSPMFLGLSTYAHGHAIASLSVAVGARLVIDGVHTAPHESNLQVHTRIPSGWPFVIAVSAATFVLAQARIEAFVLAVLLVLPVLWREKVVGNGSDFLQRLIVSLSGPIGFTAWFTAIGANPPGGINPILFYSALFGGTITLAAILYVRPTLREIFIVGIPAAMMSGLFFYLLPIGGSRNNLAYLWNNLFEGLGYWGYTWWAVTLLVILLALSPQKSSRERLILWLAFVAILFTVLVKAFDGSLERWGSIRDGWSDSVNRTVFHTFSLVTAIAVIAVSRLVSKGNGGKRMPLRSFARKKTHTKKVEPENVDRLHNP